MEIVHITGIAVLVGAAFLFDLRLLGFSKNLPVSGLAKHLLPWSQRGLWLIVPPVFYCLLQTLKLSEKTLHSGLKCFFL